MVSAPGDIGGAQAQVLSAAQMSIGARVRDITLSDMDRAIWKKRSLARAWCMRRTMFLVPSRELAMFVRGSTLRAERGIRWVIGRGVSSEKLEALMSAVLDALDEPTTHSGLVAKLSESMGYNVKHKSGDSGWGNRRRSPWVDFGPMALPPNFLLHLAGARGVYCSGPDIGGESTFVRADKWLPDWKDMPQRRAERLLLVRYLKAHGPSTIADFTIWTGMTARDAKSVWSLVEEDMAQVDVDGWRASVLQEDLPHLMGADLHGPVVKLLPFFDSFLLGHKSHRNIVSPADHKLVYRPAGWVSQVVLVDGRAAGVWSHVRKKRALEVKVRAFARLPSPISKLLREEAEELGRFLGSPDVRLELS